jgi:hypothetical protein
MITAEQVKNGTHTQEAFLIENFFQISNRDLVDVPFVLNDGQRRLDTKIAARIASGKPVKMYHPKARRRGVSAYITGRFLAKCLTQRNIQAAVVAHRKDEAKKLFGKIGYYIKHFRGAKPKLLTDSTIEVSFPETDSNIAVFTAGAKEVARGLDCNHIHLSEAAFYEYPEKLVASLVQTVPGRGEVFVESTGNGAGTWYHRRCLRAWEGRSDYGINFIPWHTTEDCVTQLPDSYRKEFMSSIPNTEFEEEELLEKYPTLEPERILWRRNKIEEFDFDIWAFKQEFPMTFEECFIPTTRSYFHKLTSRTGDPRWKRITKDFWLLDNHPNKTLHYGLGGDVAAGVENDASVVEIICLETNEQVAEFHSNRIAPNDFTNEIESIGAQFDYPLALIEANNHGHVTLDNLVRNEMYPPDKIYWDEAHSTNIVRAGHTTNRRTKPLMVGALRTDMAQGLTIYSEGLSGECATFEDSLEAASGCYDDRVIALALANKAIYELRQYADYYTAPARRPTAGEFGQIFASRNPGLYGQRQPIKSQVGMSSDVKIDFSSNAWLSSPGFLN